MILKTRNYNGDTILSVIHSLEADDGLSDFLASHNLPSGDVREVIASRMVYDDPESVEVDEHGKVS